MKSDCDQRIKKRQTKTDGIEPTNKNNKNQKEKFAMRADENKWRDSDVISLY